MRNIAEALGPPRRVGLKGGRPCDDPFLLRLSRRENQFISLKVIVLEECRVVFRRRVLGQFATQVIGPALQDVIARGQLDDLSIIETEDAQIAAGKREIELDHAVRIFGSIKLRRPPHIDPVVISPGDGLENNCIADSKPAGRFSRAVRTVQPFEIGRLVRWLVRSVINKKAVLAAKET